MDEIAARFRKVAEQFTRRVEAEPETAWENPSPCEGWAARDVVRHLVEWVPAYFEREAELAMTPTSSVDDDPSRAWAELRDALQAALDDAEVAARRIDGPPGPMTIGETVDMIVTPDVLVHTWDLARATGLDESLDRDEVRRLAATMEPYDEALRSSGHYGPRVAVPADAGEQARLLAFMGRQP